MHPNFGKTTLETTPSFVEALSHCVPNFIEKMRVSFISDALAMAEAVVAMALAYVQHRVPGLPAVVLVKPLPALDGAKGNEDEEDPRVEARRLSSKAIMGQCNFFQKWPSAAETATALRIEPQVDAQ